MKMKQSIKYLSYPQAVFVVCTYDRNRKPNLMTVALAGMCSHNPPYFFISIQHKHYTHENILGRKAFSVNVPSRKYLKELDYVGLVSGRVADKFSMCRLTAVKSESVDAPYIAEFPTHAECRRSNTLDLGSHSMFIGEILKIMGEESVLTGLPQFAHDTKDIPDMIKSGGIVYAVAGDHRYYCSIGEPLEKAYSAGRQLIS